MKKKSIVFALLLLNGFAMDGWFVVTETGRANEPQAVSTFRQQLEALRPEIEKLYGGTAARDDKRVNRFIAAIDSVRSKTQDAVTQAERLRESSASSLHTQFCADLRKLQDIYNGLMDQRNAVDKKVSENRESVRVLNEEYQKRFKHSQKQKIDTRTCSNRGVV